MNKVILKSEPQGQFEQISVMDEGWRERVNLLIQERRGWKFDLFDFPNISNEIKDNLNRQGYIEGILGDLHFLIPRVR